MEEGRSLLSPKMEGCKTNNNNNKYNNQKRTSFIRIGYQKVVWGVPMLLWIVFNQSRQLELQNLKSTTGVTKDGYYFFLPHYKKSLLGLSLLDCAGRLLHTWHLAPQHHHHQENQDGTVTSNKYCKRGEKSQCVTFQSI